MKRKVIKLAEKTFVVSLPSSFIKKYDIDKGDELDFTIQDDKITYYTQNPEFCEKIDIDIRKLDKKIIRWLIAALYKKGVDEIEIKLNKNQRTLVANELKEYTGYTIMEENESRLLIKSLANENKEQIHNTLRRAFRVTIKMANDLLENIKTKKDCKELLDLEIENNQLVNFCERIINKKVDIDIKKKTFYYVIAWNLEKICDNFKYICYELEEEKDFDKNELIIFENLIELLEDYYKLFYSFDINLMNNLYVKGKKIKEEIKKIEKPSFLSFNLSICLQQIIDMSSSYIGIHY